MGELCSVYLGKLTLARMQKLRSCTLLAALVTSHGFPGKSSEKSTWRFHFHQLVTNSQTKRVTELLQVV